MNKNKVVSNMIWRFAERVLAQLVAFVVSIVLARILEPAAYGKIALITVFTSIFQVFVDSGLGNALIQKKDADNIDFTTVFYTNIVLCFILYTTAFLIAPLISDYYNDAEMTQYIRVLSVIILISGVKNVQQAYVSRYMLFRKFFFSTLGGTIAAGIVGVILAIEGFGAWALIAQHLVNLSIDTLILWITVKWRPNKCFSITRLKHLFSFGWKLLISSLLDTVYRELRQLIIGKNYSSEDLAYYNQGDKIPKLVVSNVHTTIDSVLLPVMSGVQDNQKRLKDMTRRSIMTGVYVMAPLMIGLAAIGENLISFLLTEKWLFSVPFLRIFAISYIFYPIHTANLNAIKAIGRSDIFLKLEILKKIVDALALIISMNISVMAMAYSLLITSVLAQIINSWPNKKLLSYSYLDQLRDIIPSICLSVFMGLCVYAFGEIGLPNYISLISQAILGLNIYIFGSRLLKIQPYQYVKEIIRGYIHRC